MASPPETRAHIRGAAGYAGRYARRVRTRVPGPAKGGWAKPRWVGGVELGGQAENVALRGEGEQAAESKLRVTRHDATRRHLGIVRANDSGLTRDLRIGSPAGFPKSGDR